MILPRYSIFKNEVYDRLGSNEKNFLFYWSLIDSSSWEEVIPPYFPDVAKGHREVVQILKKSSQIREIIKKDPDYFLKRFVEGEFLANYLLAAELELKLGNSWVLDVVNLQKTDPLDIMFKKNGVIVSLEIKGMLSAANLKDRIVTEVKPYLGSNNYDNFLLLLLFPVCPGENPTRINQLIEGYYIYEEIIKDDGRKRQVFCQCFTENEKIRRDDFTLDNLAERIVENYFKKLAIV